MSVGNVESINLRRVTRHRILGDGVLDLIAVGIGLRILAKAPAPAVLRCHEPYVLTNAVGEQIDGDALRPQAVRVVRVVPGLRTGNDDVFRLDSLGYMHVGKVKSGHDRLVTRHLILGDGVGDIVPVRIGLRKLAEGICPSAALVSTVRGHSRAVLRISVCKQIYSDALRSDTVLVILIVPGLGAFDLDRLGLFNDRLMAVGHVIAVDRRLVSRCLILGEGVNDLGAVLVKLIKSFEVPAPAFLLRHICRSDAGSVRIQIDSDLLRPAAVRVILVIPGLRACDGDSLLIHALRNMDVGHIPSVDHCGVAGHVVLGDGVADLGAVRVIFRKLAKAVRPSAVCIRTVRSHDFAVFSHAVGPQHNSDPLRSQVILVVSVVPGLRARNGDLLGIVLLHPGVGDDEAIIHISGNGRLVAFDLRLAHAEYVLSSEGIISAEIGSSRGPHVIRYGIIRSQDQCSRIGFRHKRDEQHLRSQAVRVVIVVPDLGYFNVYGIRIRKRFRFMLVDNVKACIGGGVARHRRLGNRVLDLIAKRIVLRHIAKAERPPSVCIRRCGRHGPAVNLSSVSQQVHGDLIGPYAVVIAPVAPGLGALDADGVCLGFRNMPVGDVPSVNLGSISGYRNLIDGVLNLGAVLVVLRQILECPAPAVLLGHCSAVHTYAVSVQSHGDACGTDSVLILRVFPELGACNGDRLVILYLRNVRVGHAVSVDCGLIARNLALGHGVQDPASVLSVLRNLAKGVCPLARSRLALGRNRQVGGLGAVRKKMQSDALRPDAVRVVPVVPGLGARYLDHLGLDSFRLMLIGDVISVDLRLVTFY